MSRQLWGGSGKIRIGGRKDFLELAEPSPPTEVQGISFVGYTGLRVADLACGTHKTYALYTCTSVCLNVANCGELALFVLACGLGCFSLVLVRF